jgi:NADPH-dependent curcumin reductase CurA
MTKTNRKFILNRRPSGLPDANTFRLITEDIPDYKEREVLLRLKYVSVDPYMRNRMNEAKSYIAPYAINEAITGDAIAEVIESKNTRYKEGDLLMGNLGWQEYVAATPENYQRIIPDEDIHPTAYLSVLGLTGLTAYFGLLDIGKPKEGETVVISGAAGAVGNVAGQIAKIKGCRVTGIAGSQEKVDYLKNELSFDDAIDYKQLPNIRRLLRKSCHAGVDIYFDNVGGEISDAVFYLLNDYARIVLCGQISMYNLNRLSMGPRLNSLLLIHRVKIQGFIVYDYREQFSQAQQQLKQWLREKKLKLSEHISVGFENIPAAFLGLFRGDNIGKQMVKVY